MRTVFTSEDTVAVQPAVVVRATGLYVQRRALGGLLAAFVSLLLLLALMPAAAWADYPTFTSWATQNVGDREISRISTMSDVHFGESNTRERFRALLIEMADFQPEMLIVTGDTFTTSYSQPSSGFWPDGVGSSFTSSYDEITRAAHHYLGDIPVVIAAGNHDYDAGGGYYTTNSGFSSYYGLVPTKNVDVFLFGASSASWTFTQAQLDGLGEYLAGRADKDKPVFIPSHYPIDDPSANQNGEHGGATNSAAAASVLAAGGDHPIFYLWGHSHQRADNRSVIGQLFQHYPSGYTTMNAGAINYRIPTTSAQGVNMTIDRASDPDRLVADVVRVSITTTPATVTQIGTYTQDLPDFSSDEEGAEQPQITAQPQDWTGSVGGTASLSVAATVGDGGTLSYQWFTNAVNSNTGGALIGGATNPSYSAPTTTPGTSYYYCVVTNTVAIGGTDYTATGVSRAARVRVKSPSTGNVWDGTIATSFGGGSGTAGDPYLIATGAQLAYLATQVNSGTAYANMYFRQTADIDLDGREWTPIGHYVGQGGTQRPFSGTYDGDGFIISNLKIDVTYQGTSTDNKTWALFGNLGGVVQNLGLTEASVRAHNTNTASGNAANAYAGTIAAYATGSIRNSYAEGSAEAISDSSSTTAPTVRAAGGLAARLSGSSSNITNSYAAVSATVDKGTYSGGLVGYNQSGGTFTNAFWNSALTSAGVENVSSTSGTSARTTAQMKAAAFVTDLNDGRGTDKQWMADPANLNQGYPIHLREVGPTDISTATIAPIPDQTWTGSPIEPSVTVTLGGVTLVRDTDYTVAYSNNTAVGTATVTVTGIGNYSGEVQATFAIVAPQLTPLTVTATAADKVYDGTRTATVTLASADIAVGDQVTLSYGQAQFDTKHVGTAKTVTVSGITISGPDAGKYELQNTTATATAAVRPAPLTITAEDQTKLYKKTFVFTGSEFGAVGLVTGESVASVTLTSAGAAAGAAPGTYPIVPSAAQPGVDTDLGDYDIEYVDGVLTVSGGLKVAPFLKPLRQADARKFRRGATIRVAFRVKDANGKNTAAAKPVLTLKQGGTVLVKAKAVKYDKAKKLYIFQLKTKPGWKIAKYKLTVQLGAGSTGRSVFFRLTR